MENTMQVKKTSKGTLVIEGSRLTLFGNFYGSDAITGAINSKGEIIAHSYYQHGMLLKAYNEAMNN